MDKITKNIFLGDSSDAFQPEYLKSKGVTDVFCVAKDWAFAFRKDPDISYTQQGLIDGHGNEEWELETAANTLKNLVGHGGIVLIHCHAGVSRSPTILALYLARELNKSFDEVVDFIAQVRSIVNPHPELRRQARKLLKETI
jgi:protein-tyrosine phosphatase